MVPWWKVQAVEALLAEDALTQRAIAKRLMSAAAWWPASPRAPGPTIGPCVRPPPKRTGRRCNPPSAASNAAPWCNCPASPAGCDRRWSTAAAARGPTFRPPPRGFSYGSSAWNGPATRRSAPAAACFFRPKVARGRPTGAWPRCESTVVAARRGDNSLSPRCPPAPSQAPQDEIYSGPRQRWPKECLLIPLLIVEHFDAFGPGNPGSRDHPSDGARPSFHKRCRTHWGCLLLCASHWRRRCVSRASSGEARSPGMWPEDDGP